MFRQLLVLSIIVVATLADLPPNYETLTAQQKQDLLWSKVSANPYPDDKLPSDNPSPIELLVPSYDQKAFSWDGDEMIAGRQKLIHTYGSVAKIEMDIFPNSSYTGVFTAGSKNIGIARLSLVRHCLGI